MPAPLRARLVAPDVPARVGEPDALAQLGDVARRLAGLVRPCDPLELVWADRLKGHAGTLGVSPRQTRPRGPRPPPATGRPACRRRATAATERITVRDGLIAELYEYYGERAHEEMLRRLSLTPPQA